MITEMIKDDITYELNFNGTLNEYIKLLRKSKKINSKQLSLGVGKSDSYVSHLENGRYKNPDYETLYKILSILEIDEGKIGDYLLHFEIISPEREDLYRKKIINNFDINPKESTPLIKSSNKPKIINVNYMKQATLDEVMNQLRSDAESIADELVDLNNETKKMLIELLQIQITS